MERGEGREGKADEEEEKWGFGENRESRNRRRIIGTSGNPDGVQSEIIKIPPRGIRTNHRSGN